MEGRKDETHVLRWEGLRNGMVFSTTFRSKYSVPNIRFLCLAEVQMYGVLWERVDFAPALLRTFPILTSLAPPLHRYTSPTHSRGLFTQIRARITSFPMQSIEQEWNTHRSGLFQVPIQVAKVATYYQQMSHVQETCSGVCPSASGYGLGCGPRGRMKHKGLAPPTPFFSRFTSPPLSIPWASKQTLASTFHFRPTDRTQPRHPCCWTRRIPLSLASSQPIATAPPVSPFSPSASLPLTMSDNINNEFQLAPFEEDVDTTDWATLQEEIMRQSWFQFDDYDWIGQAIMDQGAEALPGGA